MPLSRLLRPRAAAAPPPPAIEPGVRVFAIGDVHGRLDLLEQLVEACVDDLEAAPAPAARFILLGDLVDRGPDSRGVLEWCCAARAALPDLSIIMGNHEEMLLDALDGRIEQMRFWQRNGGDETLASYGLDPVLIAHGTADAIVDALGQAFPPAHHQLLQTMTDMVRVGDYCFVHAGIRPGVPLDKQKRSDLRWIRGTFLDDAGDHGAVIVHGHTISDAPDEQPNRIGIDTGAYATGRLTALVLEGETRRFLST